MSPAEAQALLAAATLVPWPAASLPDARALVDSLLAAGVPAALGHDPSCRGGGCRPAFQVLVREEDAPRLAALQREQWLQSVEREGVSPLPVAATPGGEPPCPACGTAAALVAGACSDCGLQLE